MNDNNDHGIMELMNQPNQQRSKRRVEKEAVANKAISC